MSILRGSTPEIGTNQFHIQTEAQQTWLILCTNHRTPVISRVMERLTDDKDYLENLVAACPWLGQDPVALAFLAKPENLMMVLFWVVVPDPQSVGHAMDAWKGKMQKLAKEHPALLQAIENMTTGRVMMTVRPRGQ